MASDAELLELLDLPKDLRGQPVEAEIELSEEEKKFHAERQSMLGGTDSAALLGFSTFRNAWDVAAEKKGLLEPWRGNERTEWGRILEQPIAREYAKRTGQKIARVNGAVRHPKFAFLGGHLDSRVVGKKKGIEVKTVERGREKWSLPGEPLKVPRDYYVQVQHYMAITGWESFDLVALFGLSRLRWYTIERNEKVIAAIIEQDQQFWQKYVAGPDLPAMEGERAKEWMRGKYPAPRNETLVIANPEQAATIARWREAKKAEGTAKKEREKLALHVQQIIGDATGVVSGDVTVTWNKDRDSTALVTDYEGLLLHYAEKHGFEVQADDIVKFTSSITTKTGSRKLLERKGK